MPESTKPNKAHHEKSPLMESVDASIEELRKAGAFQVKEAALSLICDIRNVLADQERRLAALEARGHE